LAFITEVGLAFVLPTISLRSRYCSLLIPFMDQNHNLVIASLVRHPVSGSYHCPLCDTPFARRSNLKRHYIIRMYILVMFAITSHVETPCLFRYPWY
jgi:uncharacterized Zn-finger protein